MWRLKAGTALSLSAAALRCSPATEDHRCTVKAILRTAQGYGHLRAQNAVGVMNVCAGSNRSASWVVVRMQS